MTDPMEIRLPTTKTEIFVPLKPVEHLEEISSEDTIEILKATYETEISRIHEAYQ